MSSKRNVGQRRQHLKGGIVIMNLKDCYIKFGGDFDEVLGRLRRESIHSKEFVKIFHLPDCLKVVVW